MCPPCCGPTLAARRYSRDLRPSTPAERRRTLVPGASTRRGVSMLTVKEAAAAFLANKRIAVTGVSRHPKGPGCIVLYHRLPDRRYDVFAVNPSAEEVEGDVCYHDLASIPGGVDAVVIATRPDRAETTMRECADLGIEQVWMHRSFGEGSVCTEARVYGREHGILVI